MKKTLYSLLAIFILLANSSIALAEIPPIEILPTLGITPPTTPGIPSLGLFPVPGASAPTGPAAGAPALGPAIPAGSPIAITPPTSTTPPATAAPAGGSSLHPAPITTSDGSTVTTGSTVDPTSVSAGTGSGGAPPATAVLSAGATAGSGAGSGKLEYALLEKVYGAIEVGAKIGLADYVKSAFDWILMLGAAIAIVSLIVYGTAYTGAGVYAGGSEAAKTAAKAKLTAVIKGVAILLFCYLLLEFINPKLVQISFDLSKLGGGAGSGLTGGGGGSGGGGTTGGGGGGTGGGGTGGGGGSSSTFPPLSSVEGVPRTGRITTFGGRDAFGRAETAGNPNGLALVGNRSQLPADFWRNDPSSPNMFGDLNEDAYYIAVPASGVGQATRFEITDNTTGRRVYAIGVDVGPGASGVALDASRGVLNGLGVTDGSNVNITIRVAPNQSVTPGPA